MAPHGTVTTSNTSAGQKTAGRKSNGNRNGNHSIIQKSNQIPKTLSGFSDSGSQSTREVLYRLTDFFDSSDGTNGSGEYWYRLDNDFMANSSTGGIAQEEFQDIHSVDLYALPRFSLDTAVSPAVVLFGVPVASNIAGDYRNAAQASTLLIPSSVSNWVHVGGWSASRLLNDTTQSLAVRSNSSGFSFACLAAWSVVDPDDYSVLIDSGVQFKVVIKVRQTMPLVHTANISVVRTVEPTWGSPGTPGATDSEPMQVQPLNVTDVN